MNRHIGIPLYQSPIDNDFIIVVSVMVCLAIIALIRQRNSIFIVSLQRLFSSDLFFVGKITLSDHFQQYALLFLSTIGASLLCLHIPIVPAPTYATIGMLFGGTLGFFLLKVMLMQLYFRLFFSNRIQLFIFQYISIFIAWGICCFLGFILLHFSPLIPPIFSYVILATASILYQLTVFYILFRHFFSRIDLIFHFILYLCTLELMPIFFLLKWVAQ